MDLPNRVAHVEQGQEPRRVRRAGCQLFALDEDDIDPACLREVVLRRDTHHASADHDHAGVRFHVDVPSSRRTAQGSP
jgi:hypothetical protein